MGRLDYTIRQMAENNASGHKRRKPGSDDSPDKSYYVLNKSLDVCGKCNKNVHLKLKQFSAICAACGFMHL